MLCTICRWFGLRIGIVWFASPYCCFLWNLLVDSASAPRVTCFCSHSWSNQLSGSQRLLTIVAEQWTWTHEPVESDLLCVKAKRREHAKRKKVNVDWLVWTLWIFCHIGSKCRKGSLRVKAINRSDQRKLTNSKRPKSQRKWTCSITFMLTNLSEEWEWLKVAIIITLKSCIINQKW